MGETKAIAVTRRVNPNEVYHNPTLDLDAEAKMASGCSPAPAATNESVSTGTVYVSHTVCITRMLSYHETCAKPSSLAG